MVPSRVSRPSLAVVLAFFALSWLLLGCSARRAPVDARRAERHAPDAVATARQPPGMVDIRVVDAAGHPAVLAGVRVSPADDATAKGAYLSAITDSKGRARFTSVPAGTYRVTVRDEVGASADYAITVAPALWQQVTLPVRPDPAWVAALLASVPPIKAAVPPRRAASRSTALPRTVDVRVVDDTGAPAAFIDVVLEGRDGNPNAFADLTGDEGTFRFAGVPPGKYLVSARSDGLTSDRFEIDLLPGAGQVVDIPLKRVSAAEQTVIVNSSMAELVDAREVTTHGDARGEFIGKIPVQNRRIEDVVAMMPGVVRTGSADSSEISIGGGTSDAIAHRIDGLSGNDPVDGGMAVQIPTAAIQSFKLITSGASAKYGEQSTGIAEIVTAGPRGRRAAREQAAAAERAESDIVAGAYVLSPHSRAGERYRHLPENAFLSPFDAPLSTFAIDVDTASYSIARSWLQGGTLPPADAVRVEEFINAFRYAEPPPDNGDAFVATTEVAGCPWAPDHRLVRIAIKGAEVDARDVPPRNLVFLVDVSGSMSSPDKLPLVQQSLRLLVDDLRDEDSVGLVVYAGAAGVVLEPTGGRDKALIAEAIGRLSAGGSTAGAAGIQAAYALAEAHFRKDGINRVVLATDGDFNVGVSSDAELVKMIEEKRAKGVFLSVLGFGTGNYQDAKMEQLADHGNGNYSYVDSLDEGRRVLVDEAAGTLYAIAKDVKIQVEVNPGTVAEYRLIGYENRVMPDQDFDDDAKDGGEIGAGHSVTALYEIVPATVSHSARRKTAELRYQEGPEPMRAAASSAELMTVKLRWKLPDGETSDKIETQVFDEGLAFDAASEDLRWAAAAAGFAMLLQGSEHRAGLTWSQLDAIAAGAVGADDDDRRAGMLALARRAEQLQPQQVSEFGR